MLFFLRLTLSSDKRSDKEQERTSKLKEKHDQLLEKRGSDVQVYANREICQGAL